MPLDFYNRDSIAVARELPGKVLVRRTAQGLCAGRIVETEAYLGKNDAASHAYRGRTKRNAALFGPPGRAYVYSVHQVFCVNVVTEPEGTAVLIRAIEPLAEIELMAERRGRVRGYDLTRGPGKLCQALAIDLQLDGWDLTRGSRLWIAEHPDATGITISNSPRIGLSKAKDLLLRFFIAGNQYVSTSRRTGTAGAVQPCQACGFCGRPGFREQTPWQCFSVRRGEHCWTFPAVAPARGWDAGRVTLYRSTPQTAIMGRTPCRRDSPASWM